MFVIIQMVLSELFLMTPKEEVLVDLNNYQNIVIIYCKSVVVDYYIVCDDTCFPFEEVHNSDCCKMDNYDINFFAEEF